ncbi:hypothetical protein Tco_1340857, partial [Tanacetum coccineum]
SCEEGKSFGKSYDWKQGLGMDKAEITRKSSKTGKHEHGKRKSTKEAGKSSQSQKVNQWSNLGQFKSNSQSQH